MTADTKVMALLAMAANFGKEMPECLLAIWLDLLQPYPEAMVNAAVRQVIQTYAYKTLPPFAILKRELDKLAGVIEPEKVLPMQAAAEWAKLIEAIARYGSYHKPSFHPTTELVLRTMGGWSAVCLWEEAKLEWKRKEFIEAWQLAHGYIDLMEQGAEAIEAAPLSAGVLIENTFNRLGPAGLPQ